MPIAAGCQYLRGGNAARNTDAPSLRNEPRGMASDAPHRFVCPLLCPAASAAVGEKGEQGEGGEGQGGGFGDDLRIERSNGT